MVTDQVPVVLPLTGSQSRVCSACWMPESFSVVLSLSDFSVPLLGVFMLVFGSCVVFSPDAL